MCEVALRSTPNHVLPPFQHKSYVRWNFSQTSPNEQECCQKQCICCCWGTTKSNNKIHLFDNRYSDLTASTHINAVLCTSVPSAQNGGLPVKLVPKVFNFTMDTPSLPESAQWELCNARNLVLKMQKNDLKPTDSLKHILYFETDGVHSIITYYGCLNYCYCMLNHTDSRLHTLMDEPGILIYVPAEDVP